MEQSEIKISQVMTGVTFVIVGLFFGIFILSIFAFPSTAIIVSSGPFAWLLETGVPIALVEAGIYWVHQSLQIDASKIDDTSYGSGFFSDLARVYARINRYAWIPLIFMVLFVVVVFTYLFITRNSGAAFEPRFEFYLFVFLFLIYFFLLRSKVISFFSNLGKHVSQSLPTYTLKTDGIHLDLKITNLADRNKKHLVKILFSELTDIQELNFAEAQSMLLYQIGPDLSLQAAAIKDQIEFLQGKIPKPKYYVFGPSTGAKTLLLRGNNLLYLISVGIESNSALLQAFRPTAQSPTPISSTTS